tara:strand:- start:189 stop:455 length:267 start_codon:yes stop_codon:yes gene_type:complete
MIRFLSKINHQPSNHELILYTHEYFNEVERLINKYRQAVKKVAVLKKAMLDTVNDIMLTDEILDYSEDPDTKDIVDEDFKEMIDRTGL